MTKPTTISGPRRKLLKSITLGGGTVVAGQAMPRSWTRPVIESVVLPVHAQTSGEQVSGPAPGECPTLSTIPGITFSCGNPPPNRSTGYQVDDSGACPVLNVVPQEGPPGPDQLQVQDGSDDDIGGASVFRNVGGGLSSGGLESHRINECGSPLIYVLGGVGDFQRSFEAQSGALWTASYSVTGDSNGLTVTDIVLQPAV